MSKNNDKDSRREKSLSEEAEELRSLCSNQPSKGPSDNGKRLMVIRRGDNEELRLVWSSYDGHPYLNISLWRLDSNGTFRPVGEKTMSVRIHELADFADGVLQAVELGMEELRNRDIDR